MSNSQEKGHVFTEKVSVSTEQVHISTEKPDFYGEATCLYGEEVTLVGHHRQDNDFSVTRIHKLVIKFKINLHL